MPDQKRRRSTVSFERGQMADVTTGDNAGESIYHGLDGEQLRAILEQQTEFFTTLVSAYERQYKDVTGQLDLLRREADIYQRGEKAQRSARQESLDGSLAELVEALEAQADDLASARRWQRWLAWAVVVLALLWLLGFLALALLIYDRYAALSLLRYWLGAGAALALALRR